MKLITSGWTIIIVALALALSIVSYATCQKAIPLYRAANYENAYADQLQAGADLMPKAKDRVKKAEQLVQERTDVWNQYVATRTPPTTVAAGGIDLSVNPYQLSVDTQKYRNSLQRAVDAQIVKGGVKVINGPYVPGPTDINNVGGLLAEYYHYPTLPSQFPIVIFNLGQVQVRGTYAQIAANVRAYKNMPHYLAVADGLALEGTGPILNGTYNLTIVGFLKSNKIFGVVPEVASASSAGGGGRGGFGGGAPGGPGGGGPGGPNGGRRLKMPSAAAG